MPRRGGCAEGVALALATGRLEAEGEGEAPTVSEGEGVGVADGSVQLSARTLWLASLM